MAFSIKILFIIILLSGLFFGLGESLWEKNNNIPGSGQNVNSQPIREPQDSSRIDPRQSKQAIVELSSQKVFLYQGGQLFDILAISSGKLDTPTPIGQFRIIYKAPKIYSKIAQCWLNYWAGFTADGKYGFHETPVCDGARVGEAEIGQPASSGCLRLKQGDAEKFYNWIEIGAIIDIY